jgi:hypothetical protein
MAGFYDRTQAQSMTKEYCPAFSYEAVRLSLQALFVIACHHRAISQGNSPEVFSLA